MAAILPRTITDHNDSSSGPPHEALDGVY